MTPHRIYYEVLPCRDGDGWNVTRAGDDVAWHPTQTDAVLDAVQRAHDEADTGTLTGLRIKGEDGKIRDERTYPRASDPRNIAG